MDTTTATDDFWSADEPEPTDYSVPPRYVDPVKEAARQAWIVRQRSARVATTTGDGRK